MEWMSCVEKWICLLYTSDAADEEDRKARVERLVEEKKITTEDCLVLGILRLQKEIGRLHGEIGGLRSDGK